MNHAINIYLDHFGLRERPFSLVPDPEFLFWSPAHKRAFAMFEYEVNGYFRKIGLPGKQVCNLDFVDPCQK